MIPLDGNHAFKNCRERNIPAPTIRSLNCHKNAWANQQQTQMKQNTMKEI